MRRKLRRPEYSTAAYCIRRISSTNPPVKTPTPAPALAPGEQIFHFSYSNNTGDNMSETSTLIGTRAEPSIAMNWPSFPRQRQLTNRYRIMLFGLRPRLGFRHIGVVSDEYAVSPDGMKMFGRSRRAECMEPGFYSIVLHDKTMRLALTCDMRLRLLAKCPRHLAATSRPCSPSTQNPSRSSMPSRRD